MLAPTVLLVLLAARAPGVQLDAGVGPRPPEDPPGAVRAVRRLGPISVDGRLDDGAWTEAVPIGGFTQRGPREGAAATEETEVRLVFDDDALYLGARLYDRAPDSVVALLARRDRATSADLFIVYLDPYHDRRSGVYFGVNAAGTLYDGTLYNDDWSDDTWDGVWEGRAARDSLGWTAELRIPYSQLRFQRRQVYVWGINFKREIARRNELDYLVVQPSNGSGFVSRFRDLVGIERVAPRPRIELLPYATARAEYLDHAAGDPFNDGSRMRPGAGLDAKLGIGSNLTVDGTVNPDFGQVEVDPAVVNLSDVETFFEERRPFFIEGASIFSFGSGGANDFWGFNWAGADFLYTRRIGRAPQGSVPSADYASTPAGTHILGATKLTGKVGSWSLGGLSALTKREFASLATGTMRWRSEVEPLTYYGTYRVLKEFRQGRRGLGFIGTATTRFFDEDRLPAELNRSAFALGVDGWTALDGPARWVLTGWAGASRVAGTPARITDLQQSSVHYFQRPDATHVRVDSAATSLSGFAGRLTVNKQKGNWMFNGAVGLIDPGYEVNDLGFQVVADQINGHVMAGYRWTQPGRLFQSARANLAVFRNYDLGGDLTWAGYFLAGAVELRSFHQLRGWIAYNPETVTIRRSRGGPLMVNQPGIEWDFGFDSDRRKPWLFGLTLHGSSYRLGWERNLSAGPSVEWRPGPRITLRLAPLLELIRTSAQYIGTFADPTATATFGNRYLFADLDQTNLSASVRLNWIFTPRVSLEIYAQPLLSSAAYSGYKELARPRSYEFTPTGPAAPAAGSGDSLAVLPASAGAAPLQFSNPNFSLASLRGNAVLRWEYRPGSTLYLVWTQNRSDTVADGDFRLGDGLGRLFAAPGNNVFLVKLSYWWRP